MLPADRALFEQIGARLAELRKQAKPTLTQEVVAERAGYTAKYIGEIEHGKRDIPLSTLRAVVESGLGLSLDAVFADKGRKVAPLERIPLPRDIELTANVLATLPMKIRRPLFTMLEAISQGQTALAAQAAESGGRWTKPRKRGRVRSKYAP